MFRNVNFGGNRGLGAVTVALLICAGGAQAQEPIRLQELDLVREEINLLQQEERERRQRIEALEGRLRALEAAAGLASPEILPEDAQALLRARNAGPERPYIPADLDAAHPGVRTVFAGRQDGPATQEPTVRREPAASQAVETVTQQEQGLFGERLSFEVGTSYSHFGDARLSLSGFLALDAIFLGRISVEEVTSDVWTVDGSARYRIGNRAQVDLNVPYLARRSNFQSGGAGGNAAGLAERTVTDHGIGDISAGVSYRLFSETATRPDVVVNARIKAPTGEHPFGVGVIEVPGTQGNLFVPELLPTGSGVWSGSVGISALKTLDPLIVFGNMSVFYAPETGFDDIDEALGDQPGDVDLGEAFQYGGGVAFALNDRSSLSFSYTQRISERSTLRYAGGPRSPVVGSGSNVAALNVGASFAVTEKTSLLVGLSIGLTADAPDFTLSFRAPFSF